MRAITIGQFGAHRGTAWAKGNAKSRGPGVDSRTLIAYLKPRYHSDGLSANQDQTWKLKGVPQMAFKPLHDRVLVKRIQSDEKTKGGLIIPDTAKEKPAEGEIVSVGEGARKDSGELIAPSVKAGDRILFGKWSGTEVTLNGEELLIMKESDILGIIS
jgi:chaperonin GroES